MSLRRSALLSLLAVLTLNCVGSAQNLPTGAESLAPERYLDVPENHWAVDAIRRLSALGVLTGYPDRTFQGARPATRYELAVVAARLVDLIGGSLAELALEPAFWSDVERAAELVGRLRRVEAALEGAAALEAMEDLERRLADIEGYLNEVLGVQRFPAPVGDAEVREEPLPRSAADTVPPLPAQEPVPAAARPGGEGEARIGGEEDALAPFGVAGGQRQPLSWWLGLSAGYPHPATLHVGIREVLPSLHLRGGVGFDGGGSFGLELFGLLSLPVAADAAVLPYLAGGPLFRGDGPAPSGGVALLAGIDLPLGLSLQERGFVYLELGPEVVFRSNVDVGLVGRAGLGYRF